MIVKLANAPELLSVIHAVDPAYRKHDAILHVAETCELQGTYWDGGSRSSYTAVDLVSKRSKGAPQYNPPQFGGPRQAPEVVIPEGVCIVKTGTFRGKKAAATVYINPANAAKLIKE